MPIGDDFVLEMVNLVITLLILGVLFYLFIAYSDMNTRMKDRLSDYEKTIVQKKN